MNSELGRNVRKAKANLNQTVSAFHQSRAHFLHFKIKFKLKCIYYCSDVYFIYYFSMQDEQILILFPDNNLQSFCDRLLSFHFYFSNLNVEVHGAVLLKHN